MLQEYRTTLAVPDGHPVFAGHFPETPLVPGVLVLDWILSAAERWLHRPVRIQVLNQVKFHSPLLPAQNFEMLLSLNEQTLDFRITREAQLVAQGRMQIQGPEPV